MTDRHVDEAKGRAKEAAGSLTGDEQLKHEGSADRAAAAAKHGVETVVDKVKDVFHVGK